MDEKKLIKKELEKTIKQEERIMKQKSQRFLEDRVGDVKEKINKKLPFDLKKKFEEAFSKSFLLVFTKGIGVIEKTYDKQKLIRVFTEDSKKFRTSVKKRNLKTAERRVKKKILLNRGISAAEGSIVGFMGIMTALADVPVFISVLIKNLNEISLHYGFDYDSENEKIYMLKLISMSIAQSEMKQKYSKEIDKIGYGIDLGDYPGMELEEVIGSTSESLAEYMSSAILMQSIPVAGFIFGGLNNFGFMGNLSKIANVKYKKRYLYKMMEVKSKE